jgi:hypothetical protein
VTNTVRYVTEQKLLSSRHARIADYEDIDGLLLSSSDDHQCRIAIDGNEGMTALADDLPHITRQVIASGSSTCPFGLSKLCGGGIVRHLHLQDE